MGEGARRWPVAALPNAPLVPLLVALGLDGDFAAIASRPAERVVATSRLMGKRFTCQAELRAPQRGPLAARLAAVFLAAGLLSVYTALALGRDPTPIARLTALNAVSGARPGGWVLARPAAVPDSGGLDRPRKQPSHATSPRSHTRLSAATVGNPDGDEITGAVQARQPPTATLVGLDPVPDALGMTR